MKLNYKKKQTKLLKKYNEIFINYLHSKQSLIMLFMKCYYVKLKLDIEN